MTDGFSKLQNWLIDSGIWAGLSPKAQAAYVVILRHIGARSRRCWPSNKLIAEKAGLSVRTVTDAIKELRVAGLFLVQRRMGSNLFKLPDLLPAGIPQKGHHEEIPQNGELHSEGIPRHHSAENLRTEVNIMNQRKKISAAGSAVEGQPAPEADQPQPVDPEEIHRYMRERAPWTHRQHQERVAREEPEAADNGAMMNGGGI